MKMRTLYAFIFMFFILALNSFGGDIQITVKDAETQKVISGAKVVLIGPLNKQEDFSSSDGTVMFPDIASGHYRIIASCSGYEIKVKEIDFDFSKKENFSGNITLQKYSKKSASDSIGSVVITVKDADTEELLSGAKLILTNKDATVDTFSDGGIAEFLGIASGEYALKVTLDGYKIKEKEIKFDFSKKQTFTGSISMETDYDKTIVEVKDAQSAFINGEKALQNDKDIMALVNQDKELMAKAEKGEAKPGEAGIIRAQAAAKILEKSMKDNNADLYRLAWLYAKSATETTPDDYYPWFVFGLVNIQNSKSVDAQIAAEGAFRNCLISNPDDFKAREYLAQALYNQKLFSAAADILEKTLLNSPEAPDQRLTAMLNLCYVRDGLGERGIKYLKELSKKYPKAAYVKLQMAILYNYLDKKKESNEVLEQVLKDKSASKEDKDFANKLKYLNA